MKTALVVYERGKQKEVNADEYDRSRDYSRNRFICPECGEAVYLTGNKDSNHFAHFRQSDVSAECDRRVDSSPTDSVYERIGLPRILMEQAIKESISIKIDGKNTYRINEERFSCESTSLIPLDYIPLSGSEYRIHYEPINKAYGK